MSARARSRPDDDRSRGGGSGAADDEDGETKEEKCKGCGKKVKFTSWLKKKSKKLHQKRKEKRVSVNSGGRVGGGGGGWLCCLCVKQPRSLDSSESPTSDPNSKEFTFDMLRTLIENNDFYSKECNPHLL